MVKHALMAERHPALRGKTISGVGGSCEWVESEGEEVKVKDDFSRELEVQLPWLFCSTCVCKVLGGKFA